MRSSEIQGDFARAVLDGDAAVPAQLVRNVPGAPVRRFGVYRNNVYASLIDMLAARFPATARLVGDDFFRAMARLHVKTAPPVSAVLLHYGGGFADFIADFPAADPVPYLADIARLEWAWHQAYHAADAEPLPLAALEAASGAAAEARVTLHPSLRIVRSAYPVVTIWQRARRESNGETVRLPAWDEDALVTRPRLTVEVRRLPGGGAAFVGALSGGSTLHEAAACALLQVPKFDVAATLAGLMESGAIARLET